jgi:epoxyqueuosine reductase QueG
MWNKEIKELMLSLGADVCGIANINRFGEAPKGFSPSDLYTDCKSVITFGVALTKGLSKIDPRLIYSHYNSLSCVTVDNIAFQGAKRLETLYSCNAVPIPCDSPYEYWDSENLEGRGLMSMKHAAVLSGLGSIGKNSLLLHPVYGTLLTIGVILTDIDLESDELSENICLESCTKCMDSCPMGAIHNGQVEQKLCRKVAFGSTKRGYATVDCNQCRVVCPMKYGK